MNDIEGYGDLEARLRVELRRRIVPPPTPPHLRREIERMADEAVVRSRPQPHTRQWRTGRLRGLVAAAAIVGVAATTFAWFGTQRTSGPAAPSPSGTHSRGPAGPSSSGNEFATDADTYWGAAPNGVGFVYVEGEGLRTTADHGATWSEAHRVPARVGDGHNPDLTSLEFLDAQHGWMTSILPAGGGERLVAYRTVDGGSTWQEATVASLPSGTSSPSTLGGGSSLWAAVHFRDTQHGQFMVQQLTTDGTQTRESGCWRYASDDGGASWIGPESGSCVGIPAYVVWVDNLLGWGYPDTSSSGNVSLTEDGGVAWKTAALPATKGSVTIQAVAKGSGALTLVAIPDTYEGVLPLRVFRSGDGGATWSYQHEVAMPGASTLMAFSVLSPEHWIAVDEVPQRGDSPEPGLQARTRVVETLDGGRTWTVLSEAAPWNPEALYWWDDTHGMTVASDPSCSAVPCSPRQKVFLTGDGGRTWHVATH